MSNFTGQKIKDTYQALLQISGSDTLADGTGSVVTNLDISASYATTASYAENGGVTSLIAGDNISISSGTGDITISAVTSSAVSVDTGSLLSNASFSNPDITYTRGDGTTFTNTLTTLVPTSASHAIQADSATSADSATVAGEVNVASDGTNATRYVSFTDTTSGQDYQRVDAGLTYNPFTNTLSTTTFAGNATSADSATIATSASHAVFADTAGAATDVNALYTASVVDATISFLKGGGGTFPITINNVANAVSASHAVNADDAISSSYASNAEQLDGLDSSAFAILSNSNIFTGATNTFNNDIVINGTASIGYLQSVTGSAKIIGDAFIILNADTPTAPFAGVKVYDTGSALTASLEWNGNGDYWILVDEAGQSAPILTGNTGSKGSETFPTLNTIVKGGGENRLVDSIITDDGSTVTVSGDISASVFEASTYFAGDLIGTASLASTATTASFAITATSASHAINADSAVSALSSSYALTASFAENVTPTFPYTGDAVISGSLNISSSITANNVLTNQTDTYASVPNIHEVVSLSKTEYDAISGSADDNTLYIISGSEVLNISDTVRNNEDTFTPAKVEQLVTLTKTEYDGVSGSADPNTLYVITNDTGSGAYIEGPLTSNVNALTISSNTASMDCSTANFFTITLVSGSDTLLEPSNIQSGQTLNLRVSQANPGNGTLSFGAGIASGSAYTATAGAGPEDILTFIAFDGTTLYTSFVQNLV